jgi:heme/copper-type cytochrome/quinol oxidase subunit 3
MTTIQDWLNLFLLVYVVSIVALFLLPFFMYFRLKGIERAAWAIVSQLQVMRREERSALVPPQANAAQSDAPTYRHVANSMFGR